MPGDLVASRSKRQQRKLHKARHTPNWTLTGHIRRLNVPLDKHAYAQPAMFSAETLLNYAKAKLLADVRHAAAVVATGCNTRKNSHVTLSGNQEAVEQRTGHTFEQQKMLLKNKNTT
eukprot:TRINITY_DN14320_c0_g1_i1.p3 TRINITY_DN14320_c0_g1~~TRINITY_DN14320_c0_g1_i1.p3  ORF type:complete len:117 (+),score=9.83 TRINITY_DN14320_c0_g1_i1:466-816(+)